ncbi:MAG TPA: DMT family transporter [Methanocella sp.]|nr:DMT family transporter [Methanocella sp.]
MCYPLKKLMSLPESNTTIMIIGLVLVNVLWGASSIAAKEVLTQLNPVETVTIRFAIAFAVVLAAALLFKQDALKVRLSDIPAFIFLSITGVSLQFVLQVFSLVYTTVTNFSLLFNLSTFFIIIFGALLLNEAPKRKQLIGGLVGFVGVFLIVAAGTVDLSLAHLPGDLMGLSSAALFGLYTVASKKISRRYSPLTLLLYTFFFGLVGMLPFYVFTTPMRSLTTLTPLSWVSLGFLAICCSVVAFLIYNHGLEKLPASMVGMSIYVTPLAGVTLAVILLGESLTIYTIAGAVLIMAGLYIIQNRSANLDPDSSQEAKDAKPSHLSPHRNDG